MFRPTPFTPSDISRSTVARRKGGKVRYFDPQTARMSGWLPKFAQAAPEAITSAFREVNGLRAVYAAMPVSRLRTVASKAGVTGSSRMRKGDVIDALMSQPLSLIPA